MSAAVISEPLSAVCSFVCWCSVVYLLRQDAGRYAHRTLVRCIAIGAVVFGALCPAWSFLMGTDSVAQSAYWVLGFLLSVPHVFWLFPGRIHKNLFCVILPIPLMMAGHTAGKLAGWYFSADESSALVLNLVVMAASYALIVSGLFWLGRRKFPGLFTSENPENWRHLWMIALILGVMQLLTGNIFLPDTFYTASTVISQGVCLAGTAAILYIAGFAQKQAVRSAALAVQAAAAEEYVAMKDRQFAQIVKGVEETRRMRHDLSQMTAAMQGMNDRGEYDALTSYCQEILQAMDDNKREVGREGS